MTDDDNSKDRAHVCRQQRERRKGLTRIDYYASPATVAALHAKREHYGPLATNSGILDAIVSEWATLTGINKSEVASAMTSAADAGICRPFRARAYDFGEQLPTWANAWIAEKTVKQLRRRVRCGAKRHRDGQPCRALSEPGKRRCKWHGGCSTGPQTDAGKARALANLRQNTRDAMLKPSR